MRCGGKLRCVVTIFEENVAAQAARWQRDYWIERDRAAMDFVNRKFAEERKHRRRTTLWHGLLILGAMFRHKGMSWWPHVLHAAVVAIVLAWTSIRALTQYSKIEAVRIPAITMLSLMIAQLCLGFTAFLTRVAWGKDAAQPELPMVISTVAHVAVGALLLATTVVLAIQVWRHVPVAFEERVTSGERNPIAA